jgi:hypothetical protein
MSAAFGQHGYAREGALAWIAPRIRADLAQMAPHAAPRPWSAPDAWPPSAPRSYLAAHLMTLYGVK